MNQNNITKSTKIAPSIFETNSFLIPKNPTIIEYAVFFGSIRILQYYRNDLDQLLDSLLLYGIHSNNPEIVYFFIENEVSPTNNMYDCFHNYNFHFLDEILKSKYALVYFCELNDYKLVKFYLEQNDQVELNNVMTSETSIL